MGNSRIVEFLFSFAVNISIYKNKTSGIMLRLFSATGKFVTRRALSSNASNNGRVLPPGASAIRLGSFLQKYGVNLTKAASEGNIEPVVGRHDASCCVC